MQERKLEEIDPVNLAQEAKVKRRRSNETIASSAVSLFIKYCGRRGRDVEAMNGNGITTMATTTTSINAQSMDRTIELILKK